MYHLVSAVINSRPILLHVFPSTQGYSRKMKCLKEGRINELITLVSSYCVCVRERGERKRFVGLGLS